MEPRTEGLNNPDTLQDTVISGNLLRSRNEFNACSSLATVDFFYLIYLDHKRLDRIFLFLIVLTFLHGVGRFSFVTASCLDAGWRALWIKRFSISRWSFYLL
jgi:hypothetical protein